MKDLSISDLKAVKDYCKETLSWLNAPLAPEYWADQEKFQECKSRQVEIPILKQKLIEAETELKTRIGI